MIAQPSRGEKAKAAGKSAADGQVRAPSIQLPKGGGAIRGIGEKFAANPVTGTGSMTVPIATSPGRAGFGPQLSLSYDSGAGNGPFGFGWSLSIPAITRKTDKGLPRYRDAEESDVFILSGAEDLVPVYQKDEDGSWVHNELGEFVVDEGPRDGYIVRRYRPRVEGLFARIERWTHAGTRDVHWRSITRDNITTLYGRDDTSRIFHPAEPDNDQPSGPGGTQPTRIFSWLICQSYDDKGNAIVYEYAAENDKAVDQAQANERSRLRSANRYLKRILYGNRTPNRDAATWRATDPTQLPRDTWMFEVVFDYGEGHYTEDAPDAQAQVFARCQVDPPAGSHWPVRQDPFSSYRAGFEVRTYRLCRRVLMFHHFPCELGIRDCLVRSTEFSYTESPIASFITSVTPSGFVRRPTAGQPNRYLTKSLPPLEFAYSQVPGPGELARQPVREVDARSLENLPAGVDGTIYQWIDLDGEGTSGILSEQGDGWTYKRNLGVGHAVGENGQGGGAALFGPAERIAVKPAARLAGGAQFLDLAADGQVDLVQMEGPVRGYYERTGDATWAPFQPFASWPDLDTRDPNLKFVDLTGDGHADILVTQGGSLTWYPSLAEAGFGPGVHASLTSDEDKTPRLVFADGTQSVYLADLSGDGLSDLVRIRNGEVCYWPNLGYGRFGAKVTMDHSPWFDAPDQFDQRRVRLADTDGSGTTDILYLRRDGAYIYFNQSGNRWSDAVALPQFPPVDSVASVQVLDLLGNGTACLVWSSPLPGRRPMRYLALMTEKPHLLVGVKNNLGAETAVQYAPSTSFYKNDKHKGNPWATRLPFPVHVVERVETSDRISGNRFITRYAYHHGFFDGVEREFRGFGMVEQWDTAELATLTEEGTLPEVTNIDPASHVPPVHIKTWFHTGTYQGGNRVSIHLAREYYGAPQPDAADYDTKLAYYIAADLLPDTVLPSTLTPEEEREACRALKGVMLRQEVYADDAPPGSSEVVVQRAGRPYTVTEQNFTVRVLQPRGANRHAVFFTHPHEALTSHHERRLVPVLGGRIVDEAAAADQNTQWLADPRVQHTMTLEVDDFGNVRREAGIAYGRRVDAPEAALVPWDRDVQRLIHITYTENSVTHAVDDAATYPDDYRAPLPAESCTYELRKPQQERSTGATAFFRFADMLAHVNQAGDGAHDVAYEDRLFDRAVRAAANDPAEKEKYFRRLIEQVRTLYRPDNCGVAQNNPLSLLPFQSLQPMALPGETYKLAFTQGLLDQVFRRGGQLLLPSPATVVGGPGADRGGYVELDGDDRWWIPAGRVFFSPNPGDTAAQELAHARRHFFLPHRYRNPFHTSTASTESVVAYDGHDLLVLETRDPIGNRVTVGGRLPNGDPDPTRPGHDYRALQPCLVTDPNGNRSGVVFDALGLVVGTAVMGKPEEALGDSLDGFEADLTEPTSLAHLASPQVDPHLILGRATTRLVYDLFAYRRTLGQPEPQPTVAYTLARETHDADLAPNQLTKIQHSFAYSDGFGREIQTKTEAESGPVPRRGADGKIVLGADGRPELTAGSVSPRWVGSGWTVFNNKGKPVRRYEPFFTDSHRFELDVRIGVSLVLFYDPVERVVATLHPNHAWEKVVFDPWRQETWDVNDTLLVSDPKTDADVGDYFRRLTDAEYLPTWHDLRTDPAHRVAFAGRYPDAATRIRETQAAARTGTHANTPTITHTDSLGRPFLTIAQNRFERNGAVTAEQYPIRIDLDIEGNERAVRDAVVQNGDLLGRIVMRYDYDLLGNRIHQASMEAGERWILSDVAGKPIRAWDSRGFVRRLTYDELRRPTGLHVAKDDAERLAEQTIYGEGQGDGANHRTRVYQMRDGAGIATSVAYDFKGNALESRRELLPAAASKQEVNWLQNPAVTGGSFTSRSTFDALDRAVTLRTPDGSVISHTFNAANLLDRVDVMLRGATTGGQPVWTPFVTEVEYDAKGQRTRIDYGNGASTFYAYDPLTFRLVHLLTRRNAVAFPDDCPQPPPTDWPGCQVQNLRYTYDPVGNITHISDDAQQTVYFRNRRVEASASYIYDAVYRLIQATGREHLGQAGGAPIPHSHNDAPRVGVLHPGDGNAMGTYCERYIYDEAGNILEMNHGRSCPGVASWTRTYAYGEASLLEPGKRSNRLTSTSIGATTETYSSGGNGYDAHGNMLRMPQVQAMQWDFEDQLQMTQQQGERTWYVYDSDGQRVRKVTESGEGHVKDERIYFGGFEIYRQHAGASAGLVRETLHVIGDEQRIAVVETRTQGNDPGPRQLIRYQLGNHLNSASLELDDHAQIISYEEYTPYGSTSYQAVRNRTETPKRYRYTGKERDEESGLYYHGARYYAPWLGRWASCDPLAQSVKSSSGTASDHNAYGYSCQNPHKYRDPSGLQPEASERYPAVLGAAESVLGYTRRVMNLATKWQEMSPRERKESLVTAAGEEMSRLGIPPPLKVQRGKDMEEERGGYTLTKQWGIVLNKQLFERGEKSQLAKAASVVLHEFEHLAEQYVAAQYLAMTKQSVAEIEQRLRMPKEIAKQAFTSRDKPVASAEISREYWRQARQISEPLSTSPYGVAKQRTYMALDQVKQALDRVTQAEQKLKELDKQSTLNTVEYKHALQQLGKARQAFRIASQAFNIAGRQYQTLYTEPGSFLVGNIIGSILTRKLTTKKY